MSIMWTRAVLASVYEVAGFIAKDNAGRATSFVLELQAAVTHLQAHPARKPLVGGLADKTMGV